MAKKGKHGTYNNHDRKVSGYTPDNPYKPQQKSEYAQKLLSVRALASVGEAVEDIAEKLDVRVIVVERMLKSVGMQIKHNPEKEGITVGRPRINEEIREEVLELYNTSPLTQGDIAAKLNIAKSTVGRIVKEAKEGKAKKKTKADIVAETEKSEHSEQIRIIQSDFESLRKMVAEEDYDINILLGAIGQLGAMKSEVYGIYVNSDDDETAQLYELIKAYERELNETVIEMTKKEPAPAATDTSSNANNNNSCNDYTTEFAKCQAVITKMSKAILGIYETMTPAEQRAFDLGEIYGSIRKEAE